MLVVVVVVMRDDGEVAKNKRKTLDITEHVLRKSITAHFGRKISQTPFSGFYPEIFNLISEKF